MKYRSEESKNPVVVNRNLDILEIPANYRDIHVPTVNETVAKNGKILPYHKKADNRLWDIQKGLIFATSAALEIADELILAQNESRPPSLRKVMGHTVNSVTLIDRSTQADISRT